MASTHSSPGSMLSGAIQIGTPAVPSRSTSCRANLESLELWLMNICVMVLISLMDDCCYKDTDRRPQGQLAACCHFNTVPFYNLIQVIIILMLFGINRLTAKG
jgi:hypothetical protein